MTRANVRLWLLALTCWSWTRLERQSQNITTLSSSTGTSVTFLPKTTGERPDVVKRIIVPSRYSVPESFPGLFNETVRDTSIRRWGCLPRNETPLVFVHIGKAGGGSVRARFAASALNVTGNKWKKSSSTGAYYAIPTTNNSSGQQLGYFCTSRLPQFHVNQHRKAFEGTLPCAATTPLGQALACPGPTQLFDRCAGCALTDTHCHRVYMGHNALGNELHWLPPSYLERWMVTDHQDISHTHLPNTTTLKPYMRAIGITHNHTDSTGTQEGCRFRAKTAKEYRKIHKKCSVPLAKRIDSLAYTRRQDSDDSVHSNTRPHWGPLYASLPVLRTTVVREPFSWLLSKFFWHQLHKVHRCDDVEAAVIHNDKKPLIKIDELNHDKAAGWAHRMALHMILQLCGEDCHARWATATLISDKKKNSQTTWTPQREQDLFRAMVQQADYNLRHSMTVVGLNGDMQGFYDMVTARISYVDMKRNPHITGSSHRSSATKICKKRYQSPSFQRQLVEGSYAIRALVGLYNTAQRVNAFQFEELQSCGLLQQSQNG